MIINLPAISYGNCLVVISVIQVCGFLSNSVQTSCLPHEDIFKILTMLARVLRLERDGVTVGASAGFLSPAALHAPQVFVAVRETRRVFGRGSSLPSGAE
ncbi:hypothetical protein [Rhizobium sp. CSW-27]|uniref:hypothetical protein n=1 Tax=Rhizobium sp. CSW-27 TaxID=2839985 RepID=UPI001C00F1AE|nr:hypothetical protein [Rhizobium sp. CSW-27]MBT9371193.1 hypothetical protein [Rhizobium sp. CSW-27]